MKATKVKAQSMRKRRYTESNPILIFFFPYVSRNSKLANCIGPLKVNDNVLISDCHDMAELLQRQYVAVFSSLIWLMPWMTLEYSLMLIAARVQPSMTSMSRLLMFSLQSNNSEQGADGIRACLYLYFVENQ